MAEKIRMGMVGGGKGAFIGAIHRLAANIAGDIDLVAGAFSRDAAASKEFGVNELGLDGARAYGSYQEMFDAENALPEDQRIQCVSIVTPNDTHAPVAIAALEAGFHVICDKPLAGTLDDALAIEAAVKKSGRLFGLTQTYTGYPLVMQVRAMVASGEIGSIRRVAVAYLQDWLSQAEDTASSKQSSWRTDPARSGESGAFADIGTHAFNLVEYMTGERITDVAAELRSVIADRAIDDDGQAMFRLSGGGSGLLSASQVCSGAINALKIEIYGDKASLHWQQEQPNELIVKTRGKPEQILRPGVNMPFLSERALANCRTPGGHPEGYIEAFANIYGAFAAAVKTYPDTDEEPGFAMIEDGIATMRFIRAAVNSSKNKSAWTPLSGIENR
ncbi:Gfo/Idh/MocA family protein [Aquisalinus flavus]|uniref:Oxidoreductase n=1 Tax=Aquisalinus flavus TaxID=1526572 RepID=A0A8J2V2Q8_9PROT|nr:Gfo/Idh/MocA family oxidoreductase [Aquisalinus flavus]MBD0425777.1 Gfo/Idh/MocA family oxidoreductase [Aquisalinus flavus]UNE48616.1 Gfo/Idh/MocA family oxidoreductase [Aquisalinus flavus]GGD13384.1 oxidoreductase [Aquisalinus flavus]